MYIIGILWRINIKWTTAKYKKSKNKTWFQVFFLVKYKYLYSAPMSHV